MGIDEKSRNTNSLLISYVVRLLDSRCLLGVYGILARVLWKEITTPCRQITSVFEIFDLSETKNSGPRSTLCFNMMERCIARYGSLSIHWF
jgi:hypothetical protein